jgi:hypothetical protein
MNVFLSWSGETSRKAAIALRDWLPCVFNEVKPFVSSEDIRKGNRWLLEVSRELSVSNFGIICLTKDNLSAPWILFEAGALSKALAEANVCTLLLGSLRSIDVKGPLAGFQATLFEKEDFRKLVSSLNASAGDKKLVDGTLTKIFEKWWPDLETAVSSILKHDTKTTEGPIERSDRDILTELLELTRFLVRKSDSGSSSSESDRGFSDAREKLQKLLFLAINELPQLSAKTSAALQKIGIRNVGDLTTRSKEDLLLTELPVAAIDEIRDAVEAIGLSLGMRYNENIWPSQHVRTLPLRDIRHTLKNRKPT